MANELATSNIVNVVVTVQDTFVTSGDFGLLLFVGTSNVIPLSERVRAYTSAFDVSQDFGSTSQETIAAQTFFAQSPSPVEMLIGRWVNVDTAGQIKTAALISSIGTIQAITDGSFNISIDGVAQDILGLDFSLTANFDDVAAVIEAGLQAIGSGGFTAATCVFDNTINGFIITSGTVGSLSTVTLPVPVSPATGTDLTTNATLNLGSGTVFDGADQETALEALQAIQAINDSFYGVTYTNILRDTPDVISIASYVESLIKIFFITSNDANALTTSTTDMIGQIDAANYNRTQGIYHDDPQYYPDVSIMSSLFTVDFLGTNTVKDLAFKPTPGIPAVQMTQTQYNNLISKNGNSVVLINGITMYLRGTMGSGRYADIQQGADWLQNYITVNVLNVLVNNPTKTPYTDPGVATLEKAVKNSLQQGVVNGFLAEQVDTDGTVIPAYTTSVPRVITVPESQKIARIAPDIQFTSNAAGAIEKAGVNGVVVI